VNYLFLLRGASCFTEETLSTGATGRPSPARKKYKKTYGVFVFHPLPFGRGLHAEKVKNRYLFRIHIKVIEKTHL